MTDRCEVTWADGVRCHRDAKVATTFGCSHEHLLEAVHVCSVCNRSWWLYCGPCETAGHSGCKVRAFESVALAVT